MFNREAMDKVKADPQQWYIEVCAVCGGQLGPGIGSRSKTGRCEIDNHSWQAGGCIMLVDALPPDKQIDTYARVIAQKRYED